MLQPATQHRDVGLAIRTSAKPMLREPEGSDLRLLGDVDEDLTLFGEEQINGVSRLRGPPSSRPFLSCTSWLSLATCFGSLSGKRAHVKLYLSLLLLVFGGLLFVLTVKGGDVKERAMIWVAPSRPLSPSHGNSYIKSSPTLRFRDNLVDGVKYVTAWPIEGFTNQYMAQVNLVYLAFLAGRVPVLPSFESGRHLAGMPDPGPLPVSEIFDLPGLADALRMPIIEWKDIKNASSHEIDSLGCWSLFLTTVGREVHFESEETLALDVSLTKVPDSARFSAESRQFNIMALASLGWSETRAEALKNNKPFPSPQHHHTMQPDDAMLCYDNLYYVGAAREYEWDFPWSPSWNLVGKHMRWNSRIEALTRAYVLRAFGLTAADPFPPYISVHVRHTDFKSGCYSTPLEHCFAPLAVYAERVEEIKAEIRTSHGVTVDKVLLASDETNQTWWEGVQELGWKRLDHDLEQTEQNHGSWYPILLDSIALSLAKGLVGTKGSTMSLFAAKRVKLWEDGPSKYVTLGNY